MEMNAKLAPLATVACEPPEKLIPLVEEIELFVRGARAQGKLWEDELEADAVEGETFHINDLVQEGEADD